MGCVQTFQPETKPQVNNEKETDEKADAPRPPNTIAGNTAATSSPDQIPQTNGQHPPPNHLSQTAQSTAPNPPRNPRSVLNNFQNHQNNQNHPNHGGMGVVPENQMVDSMGNVHANNYYNQTRNHNLSMISKVTDMSAQIASPPIGTHGNRPSNEFAQYTEPRSFEPNTMTLNAPIAITPAPSGPSMGTSYDVRERVESTTATHTKWLWNDASFSEKGSVMTLGGSVLTGNEATLGSFNEPNMSSIPAPLPGSFGMSMG